MGPTLVFAVATATPGSGLAPAGGSATELVVSPTYGVASSTQVTASAGLVRGGIMIQAGGPDETRHSFRVDGVLGLQVWAGRHARFGLDVQGGQVVYYGCCRNWGASRSSFWFWRTSATLDLAPTPTTRIWGTWSFPYRPKAPAYVRPDYYDLRSPFTWTWLLNSSVGVRQVVFARSTYSIGLVAEARGLLNVFSDDAEALASAFGPRVRAGLAAEVLGSRIELSAGRSRAGGFVAFSVGWGAGADPHFW